jgi:hypothetical protein
LERLGAALDDFAKTVAHELSHRRTSPALN